MNVSRARCKRIRTVAVALALSLGCASAYGARKPPVQWTVEPAEIMTKTGQRCSLKLHGTIEPGWHLYALQEPEGGPIPTEVSLAVSAVSSENSEVRLLRVEQSRPITVPDPVFQVPTSFFTGQVDFTLHLLAAGKPGSRTVQVQVRYQSCNDRVCLPPHTDMIDVPWKVTR